MKYNQCSINVHWSERWLWRLWEVRGRGLRWSVYAKQLFNIAISRSNDHVFKTWRHCSATWETKWSIDMPDNSNERMTGCTWFWTRASVLDINNSCSCGLVIPSFSSQNVCLCNERICLMHDANVNSPESHKIIVPWPIKWQTLYFQKNSGANSSNKLQSCRCKVVTYHVRPTC